MREIWHKPTVIGILVVGMAIAVGGLMGGADLLAQVANKLTEDGSSMKKQAKVVEFSRMTTMKWMG